MMKSNDNNPISWYKIDGVEDCLNEVAMLRAVKAARCVGLKFMAESELLLALENRVFRGTYSISSAEYREFEPNNLNGQHNIQSFELLMGNARYQVPADGWFIDRLHFNSASLCYHTISMVVDRFTRGDFPVKENEGKMHYRYVSPVSGGRFSFREFQCSGFDYTMDNRLISSVERTRITIAGSDFDTYFVSKDRTDYICIDNVEALTIEQFSRSVTAIVFGLGFVCQHILLDEEYLFVLENRDSGKPVAMRYFTKRESVRGQYTIFTTNPYSVLVPIGQKIGVDATSLAEIWMTRLAPMSKDVLSGLCQMLYDHDGLVNAVTMIVESSKSGLEIQGAVLSVALEAINHLIPEIMEKRGFAASEPKHPMNPKAWKQLRKQIEKDVKSSNLSEYEKAFFINKRLNSANQPTNTDTLTACFSKLGISITDEERNIVRYRNRFLHGQLPVRNVIEEVDALCSVCQKMHHLCALLLLKLAGYGGYVVDYSLFSSESLSPDDLSGVFRKM